VGADGTPAGPFGKDKQNLMKYEEPSIIEREQPMNLQERSRLDSLFD